MLKTKISIVITVAFLLIIIYSPSLLNAEKQQPNAFESISLYKLAGGFELPVGVVSTGIEGDSRLFVLEKNGKIQVYFDGEVASRPFLDLTEKVSTEQERGLMSLVFDPNYQDNGHFYVHYSEGGDSEGATYGDTVISRFTTENDSNVADISTEKIILEVGQEFNNHNGGEIFFDLSGNLIIGLGDGGGPGDPFDRAMDRSYLLGKMLRINVHSQGLDPVGNCGRIQDYKIPTDNPRPNGENGWCPEILSAGLRNPWRSSLDPETGKIFVADVGENRFEEINIIPSDTTTLINFGWPWFEAWDIFKFPCDLDQDSVYRVPFEGYARLDEDKNFIGSSITGGYVYSGVTFPEWDNQYFYGDYISGRIWALDKDTKDSNVDSKEVILSDMRISSFGQDSDGELYVLDLINGDLYQMIGNQGLEVQVSSPTIGETGKEVVWRYEFKNIGAAEIRSASVRQAIPVGVQWTFGGTIDDNIVQLDVESIAPGESKTVLWTGRLPGVPQTLLVSDPFFDTEEISYVVNENKVHNLIVTNFNSYVFLPYIGR
ncbi:MAG: PQQ-dependent sugar dehydrogenase [Chloroflexota bacterium]